MNGPTKTELIAELKAMTTDRNQWQTAWKNMETEAQEYRRQIDDLGEANDSLRHQLIDLRDELATSQNHLAVAKTDEQTWHKLANRVIDRGVELAKQRAAERKVATDLAAADLKRIETAQHDAERFRDLHMEGLRRAGDRENALMDLVAKLVRS